MRIHSWEVTVGEDESVYNWLFGEGKTRRLKLKLRNRSAHNLELVKAKKELTTQRFIVHLWLWNIPIGTWVS